jgi:general stress protein 26
MNDTKHLSGDAAIEKVRSLLKHFRSTMMVTIGTNGSVHARPMGIQGDSEKFGGTLWFFTDKNSGKIQEVSSGPTSLVFQSDSASAYLHLVGKATEVEDKSKMKELFTPLLKTWFPQGLDDPRLTLIRFDADHGDFWDSPGGLLQVLAAFTKAMVTGTPGQGGELGDLRL